MGFSSRPKQSTEAPDAESADVWNRWFDTEKTSIAEALTVFTIDTDTTETDEEGGGVRYCQFELRVRQKEILDQFQEYFWKLKRRAARLVLLKCRRYGASTFFIMLGLERTLRVPGYRTLLVAQDDTMARTHFQRLRATFQQIPKWVLAERGITVVKDTDNQLILRHGTFKESEFRVAPAKRHALGRGDRFNFLILTEYPIWPKSAKKDLTGIMQCCQNVVGNIIVFESTAHGFDEFERRYTRAKKRKSDFRAKFIAAFENPINRKAFETAEAETAFIASIGKVREYGAEDEIVLFRRLTIDLKWTPSEAAQFLHWRRFDIEDNCEGYVSFHKRENPNTDLEAFQGTGLPVFNKAIIEAWRPHAEAREEQARRGRLLLVHDKIEFVLDVDGELTVFEEPVAGETYTIHGFGADVASGIEKHADGRTEADYSVCYIKNARTKVTVARYRAHIPEDEFAEALFRLACWYGGARGYIERAINSSGVAIDRFEDCEQGDYRGSELLLTQKRLIKSDHASMQANYKFTPGFATTPKTKPQLVNRIRVLVKETGLPDAEGKKPCPWDIFFIDEAMKFERIGTTGRMEASSGHDDCVMAEGMALEACERILEDLKEDAPLPAPKPGSYGILLKYAQREIEARENDAAEGFVSPPGMEGF